MIEYPKIAGPYRRHPTGPDRNRPIIGSWARPEFEELADLRWSWTEKVDGTNIRLHWDGHRVSVFGRTDRAHIPATLLRWIEANVHEELLEQQFGANPVIIFGEGYGPGIQQAGRSYGDEQRLVIFDVLIDGWWLLRPGVLDITAGLGLDAVPELFSATIPEAIDRVTAGVPSVWGDFPAEGVVGRTTSGLLDRSGQRLMIKVKRSDFARRHQNRSVRR